MSESAQDVRVLATPRAFRLVAARRGGEARLIVRPGPGVDVEAARRRLARLAEAHRLIAHPAVPRTVAVALDGVLPSVELACAAEADGFAVIGLFLRRGGRRIPYPAGAFIVGLREALEAAHAAGWVLGRISLGQCPSTRGGGPRWWVSGERGRGGRAWRADPRVRFFEAPEPGSRGRRPRR
ncbi:MAG: hypothetical protein R3B99_08155 [Polyangiales bacterium]